MMSWNCMQPPGKVVSHQEQLRVESPELASRLTIIPVLFFRTHHSPYSYYSYFCLLIFAARLFPKSLFKHHLHSPLPNQFSNLLVRILKNSFEDFFIMFT